MKNITASVDADGILTLKIDTKARLGESASGKSVTVASTLGNKGKESIPGLPDGVFLGVNCYAKK